MKYYSVCCMCGRETQKFDGIAEHFRNKAEEGFITFNTKSFCLSALLVLISLSQFVN